jgi:hypothetical protein
MLECIAIHELPEKGESFEMKSKRQIKLSVIGWAILFAIAVILWLIGLPLWYFAIASIIAVIVDIAFAKIKLRTLNSKTQPLLRLELQTHMVYDSSSQTAFAVITNTGVAPLKLGYTWVALAYTSAPGGRPALGGNGLDSLSLTPAPVIPTLAPGETRKIKIFGPDRQLEIAQQHVSSYNQKVADEVTAAGSVLKFLQQDKSGIFSIIFRVPRASGAAWLHSERLQA